MLLGFLDFETEFQITGTDSVVFFKFMENLTEVES